MLGRLPPIAQRLDQAKRLAVERHRPWVGDIEHRHSHGRGLHQCLQIGPRALLFPVGARVGDGHRRVGGEHRQNLLVLRIEGLTSHLACQIEVSHVQAAVAHGHAQKRVFGEHFIGEPQCLNVRRHVRHGQRAVQVAQALEEPRPVGPRLHPVPFAVR